MLADPLKGFAAGFEVGERQAGGLADVLDDVGLIVRDVAGPPGLILPSAAALQE